MSTLRNTAARTFKSDPIRKSLCRRHMLIKLLPPEIQEKYKPIKILGKGEFGVAFEVEDEAGNHYAIKQVFENPKFKLRELLILKRMKSRYILSLHDSFYTKGPIPHTRYINLVTDLMPENLQQYSKPYFDHGIPVPLFFAKLFAYQMFAGLAYLHQFKIVHRDICPKNIFVDEAKGKLIIGDFSMAKQIIDSNEDNVSYIVERPYRAPELICGKTKYGPEVDVWAAGCVFAELILGKPLFNGSSPISLLYDIASVLGPPSKEIQAMYGGNKSLKYSKKATRSIDSIFKPIIDKDGVDLFKDIFQYDPSKRPTSSSILDSRFFDELFNGSALLPNGERLPVLIRGGIMHFEKLNLDAECDDCDGDI